MRRRDVVFACLAWGGLLAGVAWALSTQVRWVQENKPIQVQRPPNGPTELAPIPTHTLEVIGSVSDDTRAAMAKGLARRKPRRTEPSPQPTPRGALAKTSQASSE